MVRGRGIVVGVALVILLVAGVVTAWTVGGRVVPGSPPLRAAPAIPDSGVGSPDVLLSTDAMAHPAAQLVRAQLQAHYNAINTRDYAAWVATVAPERSSVLDEEEWLTAYNSTQDGTIRIDRIDDIEGSRVLARVRLVSVQDVEAAPAAAPARRVCWYSSLPMSGVPPLIEATGEQSSRPVAC